MGADPRSLDITEIMKLLPHRYPFLMVDRILEVEEGQRIVGLKNVTINENFFQGHFPSQPVMPGVLIMEGMAQVAAILAYLSEPESVGSKLVYFAGMDGVRFRQKVMPGDQLIFEVLFNKRKSRMWMLSGKAFVNEKLVAEAQLMATLA
jgi:3-hydroxyacyl-[acyl-carrier-protein] dehydratase